MTHAEPMTQPVPVYAAPEHLADALALLTDRQGRVVAGGTDLMIQSRSGAKPLGAVLVNIRRIAELSGIDTEADGRIRLGPLTSLTEILENQLLRNRAPLLPAMADRFASNQIRNMATIGGNLCNASPAGDGPVALLALEAELALTRWDGEGPQTRSVPLDRFFTGPGTTVLAPGELLTAIRFTPPPPGFRAGFAKSGPRPALEIATVSAAVGFRVVDGRLTNIRIALGAVAPTPIRVRDAEAILEGQPADPALIERAADAASREANPIDDVRADAWYRRHLVKVFVRRLLVQLSQGAPS